MPPMMPQKSGIALTVKNLDFKYDSAEEATLKGINMELPKGARCLLLGKNGSGKSTFLRIVGGRHLAKPDDSVILLGRNIA
mmetsp:Transcript_12044/g.18005  ORF Transcript_12044/g.18005 Transcript_12044/m.18005 type:complete len:81 (+) Transcript_12044:62-304(+)